MQITRATVSRYLKSTGFPERAPYPRLESKLEPYTTYLSERWAAGETNAGSCGRNCKTKALRAR